MLLLGLLLLAAKVGAAANYEAVDSLGARITLAQPAQRIVSLSPHATELIDAAGAGDRLVAVTQACDFPTRVNALPRIASAQGVNFEALLAAKPDLVIVWPAGNRPQDIERIRALRIPVFATQPETLANIADDIEKIGVLTGTQRNARAAAEKVRERIRNLGDLRATTRSNATRVFYQLGAGLLYTLNDQHPVMEIIARCGGRNVFGSLPQSAPQVSVEAVLNAQPQLIVLADVQDAEAMRAQWLSAAFTHARPPRIAVVDGRQLHRPTPRMFDAAENLCRAIRDNNEGATLTLR